MKKTLFTLVAMLFIWSAKAQNDTIKRRDADTLVYSTVEYPPQFHGGTKEFYHFLAKTLRYPATAREHNTQGRVVISMIVEKDGTLTHIKVSHSVSYDLDGGALRVMKLCPKWDPGTQKGYKVRVYNAVPLTFSLSNE